jgi:mobilome CxxCx(11)CxxC protein
MSIKEESIRKECWNKSLHTLGTSYVFQLKTKYYKKWIRIITILGLVVPLLLGAVVAAYGQNSKVLEIVIIITAPIGIFQIVLSGISLVAKWDDQLAYALESQTDNRVISDEYENLAKWPPLEIEKLEKEFAIIKTKDDARIKQDEKISFSPKENRKGMRYALWIRQKECVTCKKVPLSMAPSSCETCGKF